MGVAESLNWDFTSFGNFLRREAANRGIIHPTRTMLQEIGTEFISLGWISFCNGVLNAAQWKMGRGLVIDGVRHIDCVATFREIIKPMDFFLVFVDIAPSVRLERLKQRGLTNKEIIEQEDHETEQHLKELRLRSDLIVNGTLPIDVNIQNIEYFFGTTFHNPHNHNLS